MCPVHGVLFDLHEGGGERFRHGGDVGIHWLVLKTEKNISHDSFRASVTSSGVRICWHGKLEGGYF